MQEVVTEDATWIGGACGREGVVGPCERRAHRFTGYGERLSPMRAHVERCERSFDGRQYTEYAEMIGYVSRSISAHWTAPPVDPQPPAALKCGDAIGRSAHSASPVGFVIPLWEETTPASA